MYLNPVLGGIGREIVGVQDAQALGGIDGMFLVCDRCTVIALEDDHRRWGGIRLDIINDSQQALVEVSDLISIGFEFIRGGIGERGSMRIDHKWRVGEDYMRIGELR